MIEVEVVLVVIAVNTKKPQDASVLLIKQYDEYYLPKYQLTNTQTTQQAAAHLLRRYTGLQALVNNVGWVPIFQKTLCDNIDRTEYHSRCIAVPYVAMIPQLVELKEAEWVRLIKLSTIVKFYNDHREIMNKAISEG